MKKLISILAIMVVLVGSVFADVNGQTSNGTAVIDIKATIAESHPTFQLKAKTITTQATGENGDILISTVANDSPTHGKVTIATDHLLTANAVIVFAIEQNNSSRSTANYTLGVAATNLTLDNYATVGASTLEADEYFEVALSGLTAADGYGSTSTNGVKITPATGSFAADYDGKVVDGSTTAVELATFTATWTKKPNAVAGNYSATVTLTITATN